MLTPTQRLSIVGGLPLVLTSGTLTPLEADQYPAPRDYPALVWSITSQNVKNQFTTAGALREVRNPLTLDWDFYEGDLMKATFSCQIFTKSTDVTTVATAAAKLQLQTLLYEFLQELRFEGLGLSWFVDRVKILRIEQASELKPMRDTYNNCWVFRAVVDFSVEYEFSRIDAFDAIKSFEYNYSSPLATTNLGATVPEVELEPLEQYGPQVYGMDITITNDRIALRSDVILITRHTKNVALDVAIVGESCSTDATFDILIVEADD